jgi:sRNA-binding carbon storage regulator CsrA
MPIVKKNQELVIRSDIIVSIYQLFKHTVKLTVNAPGNVLILRSELIGKPGKKRPLGGGNSLTTLTFMRKVGDSFRLSENDQYIDVTIEAIYRNAVKFKVVHSTETELNNECYRENEQSS